MASCSGEVVPVPVHFAETFFLLLFTGRLQNHTLFLHGNVRYKDGTKFNKLLKTMSSVIERTNYSLDVIAKKESRSTITVRMLSVMSV